MASVGDQLPTMDTPGGWTGTSSTEYFRRLSVLRAEYFCAANMIEEVLLPTFHFSEYSSCYSLSITGTFLFCRKSRRILFLRNRATSYTGQYLQDGREHLQPMLISTVAGSSVALLPFTANNSFGLLQHKL